MTEPSPPVLNSKLLKLGVGASFLLVLAAGAGLYYASSYSHAHRQEAADGATIVTIAGNSCDPNELTVPAGRTTFSIVNKSDRTVEWEILDGVMVLEERENIAPGFAQSLVADLEPGNYQVTCGLLSNPRGTLHVTPSASSAAAATAKPSLTAFLGAMAEYKFYLGSEAADFSSAVDDLAEAIKAGDLAKAQSLYEPARISDAHLAAAVAPISDIDNAINARADNFEKQAQDPNFVGLHRLEYGLFAEKSLDGLAPIADRLVADAATLSQRIHDLTTSPEQMVAGSVTVMDHFATAGEGLDEDRYAHTDLASFNAELAGVQKVAELVKPVVAKTHGELSAAIDQDIAALHASLERHRAGDGFAGYDTLSASDKAALKKQVAALAGDLGKLRDILR